MQKESLDFLTKILETPSVSGFEGEVQRIVKRRMNHIADTIDVDVHGNLIAAVNPDAKVRVMLAGHCDQIGLMVTHIDEKGFLWVGNVGGIDTTVLPGSWVNVLTEEGPVPGVIGVKPIHTVPGGERGKPIEIGKVWIDIGVKDGKEAKKKVRIGDAISFNLGVSRLGRDLIVSPGCDDKTGTFVVMEALRLFKTAIRGKKNFPVALFAVSTVQEELGLRGARTASFGVDPLVGIAVDVTHATDNPGSEAKSSGAVALGQGPVIARGPNINPVIERLLLDTAKKRRIPHQLIPAPGATGTDANAIQVNRAGVAASLVSIPNRYMHSQVEVVSLKDLELSARLISETVLRITARTSFVPA